MGIAHNPGMWEDFFNIEEPLRPEGTWLTSVNLWSPHFGGDKITNNPEEQDMGGNKQNCQQTQKPLLKTAAFSVPFVLWLLLNHHHHGHHPHHTIIITVEVNT